MELELKRMEAFRFYLLGFALLVIIPLAYFIRWARPSAILRLPPGPWALPVIGHLHHLIDKPEQLHHKLRDLAQRHGSVMLLRCGELPVVVASSMEAAREVMKTHDLAFATRPISRVMRQVLVDGSEGLILAPYGAGWRQLRKICTLELLSAHRVRSLRAVREQEVERLLRAVASTPAGGAVNMSKQISSYVADTVVRAVIGSQFGDRKTAFFRMLEEGMKVFSRLSLPDIFPSSRLAMLISRRPRQMKQLRQATMAFMETTIQEHQQCKATAHGDGEEDLVDVLLRVQGAGGLQSPLTMDNMKTVLADLIMAGSETSSTTLLWAMSELVKNPRVMHKAQEEIRRVLQGHKRVDEESLSKLHYLHLVVKETLRLHPSTPLLIPRECRDPCQILGFDIPVGAMLLVNVWAISRDTRHWDAPHEFVPERFEHSTTNFKGTNFEYTPFGAGRRMCPGMAFGLPIVEPALASLLYHFDWELPCGMLPKDLDMTEVMGVTMRRQSQLLLLPQVRVPI